MFTKNKVMFFEHQLEDFTLENSVLKSKLESKIAALAIMSKELDKSCMERDRYKSLVEQFNSKKGLNFVSQVNPNVYYKTNMMSGGEMLANTRQENNLLKVEVATLKAKLEDASQDIAALRQQINSDNKANALNECNISYTYENDEDMVHKLEILQNKYKQLKYDYRSTIDEMEEIMHDKEYYKNKLIDHMNTVSKKVDMSGIDKSSQPVVDVNYIIMENKYLQESITQLQKEKEIIEKSLHKYKVLVKDRNKNNKINIKSGFIDAMTQSQVREYLQINPKLGLKSSSASELKSLCLGLIEALNDKSIALQHQKKTNQILANRINVLERTIESWSDNKKYSIEHLVENEEYPITGKDTPVSLQDGKIPDESYTMEKSELVKQSWNDKTENSSDNEASEEHNYSDGKEINSKTVLPQELQELVKEALEELKSFNEDQ